MKFAKVERLITGAELQELVKPISKSRLPLLPIITQKSKLECMQFIQGQPKSIQMPLSKALSTKKNCKIDTNEFLQKALFVKDKYFPVN